jgi:hypothetical protein
MEQRGRVIQLIPRVNRQSGTSPHVKQSRLVFPRGLGRAMPGSGGGSWLCQLPPSIPFSSLACTSGFVLTHGLTPRGPALGGQRDPARAVRRLLHVVQPSSTPAVSDGAHVHMQELRGRPRRVAALASLAGRTGSRGLRAARQYALGLPDPGHCRRGEGTPEPT